MSRSTPYTDMADQVSELMICWAPKTPAPVFSYHAMVLSKEEAGRLFQKLVEPPKVTQASGRKHALAARLQYGAGLRRSERVRLGNKDIDLTRGTLTDRQGKGDKDCLRGETCGVASH